MIILPGRIPKALSSWHHYHELQDWQECYSLELLSVFKVTFCISLLKDPWEDENELVRGWKGFYLAVLQTSRWQLGPSYKNLFNVHHIPLFNLGGTCLFLDLVLLPTCTFCHLAPWSIQGCSIHLHLGKFFKSIVHFTRSLTVLQVLSFYSLSIHQNLILFRLKSSLFLLYTHSSQSSLLWWDTWGRLPSKIMFILMTVLEVHRQGTVIKWALLKASCG